MGDSQEKVEKAAVMAVGQLVNACDRLEDRFSTGDKMPLTDGAIDVYEDRRRDREFLQNRVPVQIKGSTTKRKEKKSAAIKFDVPRPTLEFFEREGGGLFFVGAMPKDRFPVDVYYLILTPIKARRYLAKMQQAQKTIRVPFQRVSDPNRLQAIATQSVLGKPQSHAPRLDLSAMEEGASFRITPLDPLDLTRPQELRLEERDFIVDLIDPTGSRVPVDIDLTIFPASYTPREVDVSVSCGEVRYERAVVRQTGEGSGEMIMSPALQVTTRQEGENGSQRINFATTGSFTDVLAGVNFLKAAADGFPMVVNGKPTEVASSRLDEVDYENVESLQQNLLIIDEILQALAVDASDLIYNEVADAQYAQLASLHDALVHNREVAVGVDGQGRYNLSLGDSLVILVFLQGKQAGRQQFFNPFDPANGSRFTVRLEVTNDDGDVQELVTTAYDGLTAAEFAAALNLRLDQMVAAYTRLADRASATNLAQQNVLVMIHSADIATPTRRMKLLQAAASLNDWVDSSSTTSVNAVNRWQILARQRPLTKDERRSILATRQQVAVEQPENAKHLNACMAMLLGDPDDIAVSLEALSTAELEQLQEWPIWKLAPDYGPEGVSNS